MLHLTPSVLCGAYDFLRTTQPFRRWMLPPMEGLPTLDGVTFRVMKTRHRQGLYKWDHRKNTHVISVSQGQVSHTRTLIVVMAHEMVHLYQNMRGTDTRAQHNAEFYRLARIVCRCHGFDSAEF